MNVTPIDFCASDAPITDEGADFAKRVKEAKGASKPITLLDGPAMAKPLPALEYLVREIGLVAGGGAPHLFAGYGFTGKTLTLQAMALSLASGSALWSAYSVGKRRVVHVDLEQGERLTVRRYQRLADAMNVDLGGLGDALALAVMPPITLAEQHKSAWRTLMSGRDLVVIDSLRAATGGQDENSSDIRSGLDLLGHISEETGCRPAVILHARKPSEDAPAGRYAIRGSSAIYDAADSAYVYGAAKGEPIAVEHVKARSHGETVEDFALVISDVEIDGYPKAGLRVQVHGAELLTERRQERREAAQRDRARIDADSVRAAIARCPGATTTALRVASGLSGDRLALALTKLGSAVEVREDRSQGRGPARQCHYLRGGT
jgi:AAA domain-containing protein